MSTIKKYLDICVDFLFFITAIYFVLGNHANIAKIREQMLQNIALDKGISSTIAIEQEEREVISGIALKARVISQVGCTIELDGNVFMQGERGILEKIQDEKWYFLERNHLSEGEVQLRIIEKDSKE